MKSNLPCIDCICIPICKSQYLQAKRSYKIRAIYSTLGRMSLQEKCTLLKDYFEKDGKEDFDKIKMFHEYINKR